MMMGHSRGPLRNCSHVTLITGIEGLQKVISGIFQSSDDITTISAIRKKYIDIIFREKHNIWHM
jgi:hypothetical protein